MIFLSGPDNLVNIPFEERWYEQLKELFIVCGEQKWIKGS